MTNARDLKSGKSSSSGSYSIGGSNPNVTESTTDKITIEKIKEIPEKLERPETSSEEKKVTEQKEQLVPKMVVSQNKRIKLFLLLCKNFTIF